jgi:hypothetical protein
LAYGLSSPLHCRGVLSVVVVRAFVVLIVFTTLGTTGRSAVFIAKGPSKKRKWAEVEAVQKESGELKEDKWEFLYKVKRIRTEHETLNNLMGQIRE